MNIIPTNRTLYTTPKAAFNNPEDRTSLDMLGLIIQKGYCIKSRYRPERIDTIDSKSGLDLIDTFIGKWVTIMYIHNSPTPTTNVPSSTESSSMRLDEYKDFVGRNCVLENVQEADLVYIIEN